MDIDKLIEDAKKHFKYETLTKIEKVKFWNQLIIIINKLFGEQENLH